MKKTVHYVLILDQSGSMNELKNEVISSFNEQIESIRKIGKSEKGLEIKVTLCVFNEEVVYKFIAKDIDNLTKLTAADYQPEVCTALYDAIGITFLKMAESMKKSDKVFLAIFTDGLENASKIYSLNDIKYKLKQAEKDGWEIKFFCRDEDGGKYKHDLNLSPGVQYSLSMDEAGLKIMESHIKYGIEEMIKAKEMEQQ